MKWFALAVALGGIWPLANWLRGRPGMTLKVWTLVGFLPFGTAPFHLYMALISRADWPGYVKGAEISLLDLLVIALYLSLPRSRQALPWRLPMALYFLAILLSVPQSLVPLTDLFYAWQIARIFLVYAVVARGCQDERVVAALLTGMSFGLAFQACASIWERFGAGLLQTGGSLGHQNLLGLMTHFVVFPCAALVLAGARGWRPLLGPVSGLVIAVLTISRATIGLAAAGYGALFTLSALHAWTSRKALFLVAALVTAAILFPIVQASFEQRFSTSPIDSGNYDERAAFEAAAGMMLADHPMGVGANHYVVAANTGGYNSRANVAAVIGSESANVHNVYLLVAAETGYFGLATFVLLLLQPLWVAIRCGWRTRRDQRGELLMGFGVALLMVYIHSFFEWIFITFSPQYMFAIDAGLVAGLATQLGYFRSRAGRAANAVAATASSSKVS